MIFKKLEVGMYMSNCYILGSESTREGLVIDPGDQAKDILNNIESLGLNIKLILLTHGHIDHIGAVAQVKEATRAQVAIHASDSAALSRPDRLLNDGDMIDLADIHLKVLHTPGHTSGSVCFLGDGIVFTGDTLFYMSVGRTDLGGGNQRLLIKSINKKLMTLPEKTVAYPGHGPETTIKREKSGNPFLVID